MSLTKVESLNESQQRCALHKLRKLHLKRTRPHAVWRDSAAIETTQSSIHCDCAAVTYHMESKQKQLTSAQRSLSVSSTKGGMSLSVLSTKVCISGLSLRDSKAGMLC